jgi:hypothetical protein
MAKHRVKPGARRPSLPSLAEAAAQLSPNELFLLLKGMSLTEIRVFQEELESMRRLSAAFVREQLALAQKRMDWEAEAAKEAAKSAS